MKKLLVAFGCALGMAATLASCGGGGDSSSGETSANGGGLAPANLTGDIVLAPTDYNVHGYIRLTNTPARVAYFGTDRAGNGHEFTGNYTYTKCGPNMVRLEIDNIRYEPIDTASDCVWNINGYMTFVQTEAGTAIVYTGTENLFGTVDTQKDAERHPDPFCNDSFGYGDGNNHFQDTDPNHHAGGSRNFSLNYLFTMEGAQP